MNMQGTRVLGWSSLVIVIASVGAGAAGCKKPECRGLLADKEVAALQEQAAKGDPACEELAKAVIKVDDTGALVNGSRISVTYHEERRQPVPPISELLGADRERWLHIHPSKPFAGSAEIFVPEQTSAGAGSSVMGTAAAVGFTHLEVKAGADVFPIDWWAGHAASPRPALHVERDAPGREVRLRFTGNGANATPRQSYASPAEAVAAVDKEWGGAPATPRAVVVRVPGGTLHELLLLTREILTAAPLAKAQVMLDVAKMNP